MSAGSVIAPSHEQDRVRRTLVVALGRPTTPGFLRAAAVLLVTGLVVSGALAVLQLSARNNAARDVEHESAPMLADAEGLYRDLADADATASRAFLTGSTESAAVRARMTGISSGLRRVDVHRRRRRAGVRHLTRCDPHRTRAPGVRSSHRERSRERSAWLPCRCGLPP